MVRSSVPPPVARMLGLYGCHVIPFIAALCLKMNDGFLLDLLLLEVFFKYFIDQIAMFLSLEPDAIDYPEALTSKAQTYSLWNISLLILFPILIS